MPLDHEAFGAFMASPYQGGCTCPRGSVGTCEFCANWNYTIASIVGVVKKRPATKVKGGFKFKRRDYASANV